MEAQNTRPATARDILSTSSWIVPMNLLSYLRHIPLSHVTLQVKTCICPSRSRKIPISVQPITISVDASHFLQLAPQLGQRISLSFFQKLCNHFFILLVCLVRTITASQRPSRVDAPFYAPLGCGMDTSSRLGRLGRGAEHVIEAAPEIRTAALRGTGTGEIYGPHMQRSIPHLANLPLLESAAEECRWLGS